MASTVDKAIAVLTRALRPYATQGRPPLDMREKESALVFPPGVMPVTMSMVGKGMKPSRHACKSLVDAAGGWMALVAVADKAPALIPSTWAACVVIIDATGECRSGTGGG